MNDELRRRGLNAAASLKSYYDVGGGVGGPIKRDTLWFFGSAKAEDR